MRLPRGGPAFRHRRRRQQQPASRPVPPPHRAAKAVVGRAQQLRRSRRAGQPCMHRTRKLRGRPNLKRDSTRWQLGGRWKLRAPPALAVAPWARGSAGAWCACEPCAQTAAPRSECGSAGAGFDTCTVWCRATARRSLRTELRSCALSRGIPSTRRSCAARIIPRACVRTLRPQPAAACTRSRDVNQRKSQHACGDARALLGSSGFLIFGRE